MQSAAYGINLVESLLPTFPPVCSILHTFADLVFAGLKSNAFMGKRERADKRYGEVCHGGRWRTNKGHDSR